MILYLKKGNIESFIDNCVPGTTQFITILIMFPILSIKLANIVFKLLQDALIVYGKYKCYKSKSENFLTFCVSLGELYQKQQILPLVDCAKYQHSAGKQWCINIMVILP